jgi:hypothetical protein
MVRVTDFAADTRPMPLEFVIAQNAEYVEQNAANRTLSKFHFQNRIEAES